VAGFVGFNVRVAETRRCRREKIRRRPPSEFKPQSFPKLAEVPSAGRACLRVRLRTRIPFFAQLRHAARAFGECLVSGCFVTIVVLYFAGLRELLQRSEERLSELSSPSSVFELAELLARRHPALVPHLGSVRFAVNEAFVDRNAALEDGDTVALIPPVSGG
jgi:molybdopterin synthase sulfur carrier subunit